MMGGLIVIACRGAKTLCDPIKHDCVQQIVFAEACFNVTLAVPPRAALLYQPSRQANWRVVQSEGQRLWLGRLQLEVAASAAKKCWVLSNQPCSSAPYSDAWGRAAV